jgi:hypothetical protein
MVAVFVGQENRVDPLELLALALEELGQALGGEAGIEQHAGVVGPDQGRVACAAAAEDAEAHGHGRD